MRFPLTGLMLLALCSPSHAEPYTLKLAYGWKAIPYVEQLEKLACSVDTYRLEQLAASLKRGGYEPATQREQRIATSLYRITTWYRADGSRVDVLHREDGTTCVWETFSPPGLSANALPK